MNPDQSAPKIAVWSGFILFAVSSRWFLIMEETLSIQFRLLLRKQFDLDPYCLRYPLEGFVSCVSYASPLCSFLPCGHPLGKG